MGENASCEVLEIDFVDVAPLVGGNRARAVNLADYLRTSLSSCDESLNRVRVLVDADFDHLDCKMATLPLVLTDGRSMESYFLRLSSFEKIFGLALMAEHVDAKEVLESTVEAATILAAAREIDRQRSLDLPFQALNLKAFIDVDASGIPTLRLINMLSQLLTQAGFNGSGVNEVASAVKAAAAILREREPLHVVHGHDLERILGEILQALRYPRQQVSQLIRSTFEVAYIDEYPMLSAVISFATAS
ncbi:hypothetical protein [Candidatus Poriferisodalis sp.]|uniref:hypothetical protein n=1 Tax=Candidatus Poriferisodalis sp. TaxID=3101277 RepID=UPI003D10EB8C